VRPHPVDDCVGLGDDNFAFNLAVVGKFGVGGHRRMRDWDLGCGHQVTYGRENFATDKKLFIK
jgi:hypothetical protein